MVVKDVEKLITDPTDEDKVPCWAEIWPSARGVAEWVWENIDFHRDELLELGTGLGLPGIVCGLKGARVTFSDFNPSALDLVKRNAFRNGLTDYDVICADWRHFETNKKYGWVLGSDIFYDPKLNNYLLKLIPGVVKGGGNLLIAHPGRQATFGFIDKLKASLNVVERRATVPVIIDDPYFPYYEIHIHYMQLL